MSLQEFESINHQIIETKKALIERDHILSVMDSIDKQLISERRKLPALIKRKNYEKYDIQALEELTPKSIFYTLLRSREAQLDKEVQEYLDAKLELENCQIKISSLEGYLLELEEHLVQLADSDEKLDELHQTQLTLISHLATPEAEYLEEISAKLPIQLALQQEVGEAYEVGQQALSGIDKVVDILLKERSSWGYWGKSSSLTASNHPIGEAIEISLDTQHLLEKFQQELTDISQHFWTQPNMRIPKRVDSITLMFVYSRGLFGNRFTDLEIQSRIKKWLEHLQKLKRNVKKKVDMLEIELTVLQRKIEKLELEKQKLLTELWNQASFSSNS